MSTKKPYPEMQSLPDLVNETAVLSYLNTQSVNISSLDKLRALAHVNDTVIASWLNINVKTLRNYKTEDAKIKDYVQEKIVLLLSLFKHGMEVMGDSKIFSNWLETSNFFFDNKTPSDFLTTFSGILFVDERLSAMEYGDNV